MGTRMFSVNGKNTTPIYVCFGHENPLSIDEKIKKLSDNIRTRFTGDKIAGIPCSKEIADEHDRIQAEIQQELIDFKIALRRKNAGADDADLNELQNVYGKFYQEA